MRLYEELSSDKVYQKHIKMHETEDKLWKGDFIVMCEDDCCQVCKYLGGSIIYVIAHVSLYLPYRQLQGVPRRLMNMILAQGLGQNPQPKQAANPAAQAPQPSTHPQKHAKKAVKPTNTLKVLQIISEESGIALGDLTNKTTFADLGVDPLLSMIISSRVKEKFGIDTDSWEFSDYPAVKILKIS